MRLFTEKADNVMLDNTLLFPDTIRVLSSLKTRGFKTGIVTTKRHDRITDVLKKYNAENLVDIIIGGEEVGKQKPAPDGLVTAMAMLGVKKDNVTYIGDSTIDARTAQAADVDFIATTTGTTEKEEFLDYPYTKIINKLSKLPIE